MRLELTLINPCGANDHQTVVKRLKVKSSELEDAVFDLVNLADSAALFFSGLYPVESPHFSWGRCLELPWSKQYWAVNDVRVRELIIKSEVRSLVAQLAAVALTKEEGEPWGQLSYRLNKENFSPEIIVQALAVEVMLAVENALRLISQGRGNAALRWMSCAFKGIVNCALLADRVAHTKGDVGPDEKATNNCPARQYAASDVPIFRGRLQ